MAVATAERPAQSRKIKYACISAGSHIDLVWLAPDISTKNALATMEDRMPFGPGASVS